MKLHNLKTLSVFLFLLVMLGSWKWIQRSDFGSVGRHRATGIAIGTKGYMGLGHYNGAGPNIVFSDWWEFDPATNAWSQKADYAGNNGNGSYGVLSYGLDTIGFVGGGQVANSSEFYKYSPVTNTWTQAANFPVSAQNNQGFSIESTCYLIKNSSVYAYNVATNSWTVKNSAPFAVSTWNSTFTIDNKGYVKNGNSFFEYKPVTDQWAVRAQFPGLATGGSVGFAQLNKGYIVAGYAGWLSEVTNEVWEFDPSINEWKQLPEFPGTKRRFSSGFTIKDRSYLGTGTNGTNFNDFWEFDADASTAALSELENVEVKCFPNPVHDQLNIRLNSYDEITVLVYNAFGQKVLEETHVSSSFSLPFDGFKPGTYICKIFIQNQLIQTERITKL